MGTLFNQLPRMERLDESRIISIGETVKTIAKKLDISFKDALNLYMAVAKIDDYDIKDEQLAGLGELLKELLTDISGITTAIHENS